MSGVFGEYIAVKGLFLVFGEPDAENAEWGIAQQKEE